MRALLRNGTFAVVITFVLVIGLLASSDDPTDGTWDLDLAASKFDPGLGQRVRHALTELTERPSR